METTKKSKYKATNLVYLVYAPNECYHQIIRRKPTSVTIDLESGTWTYQSRFGGCFTRPFGQSGPTPKGSGGIIGVYDVTKIGHLDTMVHDVGELVRQDYRSAFDD